MTTALSPTDLDGAQRGRRSFLGRLGAVLVGVATSQLLSTQQATANPPPLCSFFNDCVHHGYQSCLQVTGNCCWYVSSSSPCKTYRCCDRYNTSAPNNYCICRMFIGNFC